MLSMASQFLAPTTDMLTASVGVVEMSSDPPRSMMKNGSHWVTGYCNYTLGGEGGNCLSEDRKGSWTGVTDALSCAHLCVACSRCHFISYAASDRDCSWFSQCNMGRLQQETSFFGHRTHRIRTTSGAVLRLDGEHGEALFDSYATPSATQNSSQRDTRRHRAPPSPPQAQSWSDDRDPDSRGPRDSRTTSLATLGRTSPDVAVCMMASEHNTVVAGGSNVAKNMLAPLGPPHPDVFLSVLTDSLGARDPAALARGLPFAVAAVGVIERSVARVAPELTRLPHFPWLRAAVGGNSPGCYPRRLAGAYDVQVYDCVNLFEGNSFLAPVLGRTGSLFELQQAQQCWNWLEGHETRRQQEYKWVVSTRLDFWWLVPHPSLTEMTHRHTEHSSRVWIPTGQDWGGVNDRHAIMGRHAASKYLQRWSAVHSGLVVNMSAHTERPLAGMNSEKFLDLVLTYSGLSVSRYAASQFLTCCDPSVGCFNRDCHTCWLGSRRLQGKYLDELKAALKTARAHALVHPDGVAAHAYNRTLNRCPGRKEGE